MKTRDKRRILRCGRVSWTLVLKAQSLTWVLGIFFLNVSYETKHKISTKFFTYSTCTFTIQVNLSIKNWGNTFLAENFVTLLFIFCILSDVAHQNKPRTKCQVSESVFLSPVHISESTALFQNLVNNGAPLS